MTKTKHIIQTLLVSILLTGCFSPSKQIEPTTLQSEFHNVFSEEAQDLYVNLEDNTALQNMPEAFLSIGSDLPDIEAYTYDDKKINLLDYKGKNIVAEFVSYTCFACKAQASEYTDSIVKKNNDIVFLQIFMDATNSSTYIDENGNEEKRDMIKDFYKEADAEMNENITIIQANQDLSDYIQELRIDNTPAFLFFNKDGKLAFYHENVMQSEQFDSIVNAIFSDEPFNFYDNLADGYKKASDIDRTWEDVKADFSTGQQDEIASLAINENYGEKYFYQNYAQQFDANTTIEDVEGNDFDLSKLQGVSVYAMFMSGHEDTQDDIKAFNEFQKQLNDENINFISLLNSDDDNFYNSLEAKPEGTVIDNVSVVSSNPYSDYSKAYRSLYLHLYDTFILIDESTNTCLGVYYGDFQTDDLVRAYETMVLLKQ